MAQQIFNQECVDKIGVMLLGLDVLGRITLINKAGGKLLGYGVEELIGVDWYEQFISAKDRPTLRRRFLRIMTGEEKQPDYHENTVLTRNGEHRVIAWHNTLLREDGGTVSGLLSTGEDITDRKDLEKRLKEGELRFGNFIEYISDAIFIYDINGSYKEVNQYACSSLGYTRAELLALKVSDIDLDFAQVDGAVVLQRTYRHKDGHTIPVEVKITPLPGRGKPLFIAIARDISKRLQQQRRLTDNRDLLRIIIDSIPDIVCIKDGRGRWLLANTFDLQLFGLEDVNYRGKTDVELARYTPLHREAFLSCRESDLFAWRKKEPCRSTEIIPATDGSSRIFDVYKIPLFHADGRRKVLVVIGRDITEQKQIEEKYRKLFEQSPLAYLASSLSGKIRAVNQAVTDTFGYASEELIGKKIMDFMTPESRRLFSRHYPKFLRGEPFSGSDYHVRRADGTIARIQVTATLIHDDKGEPSGVQSVIVDVTRQRRIEEQIRASEARYRQLFERAPIGIVHFDTGMHVTDCNDHYLQIMQAEREQIIGLDIRKMRDKRVLPLLEGTLTGKEGRWEGFYKTTLSRKEVYLAAHSVPLYDTDGNVQGGMILVEDMSLKRKAQEEKYRLMSAIDQAFETIVITDKWGVIEYVNPAFEKVSGYSAEEVHGKNPRILKSDRHGAEFYREMWQTLRAGRVWKGHLINKRKDGTLFEENATISPVRDREGKIINYVAVKRDVTEEVALKKQLNQAMKMEAIGTLAGGIAHDFNNILSAVLGYAEMVEMQLADDDPARKDVSQIIDAGQRATGLIRQILTFSRQEEEELRPVKLQFVIKEALKLLRSSLPTSIELQQEIDTGCGPVLADPIRIHQVLMNLCTNAKQAMEGQQGTLRVRLAEYDIDSGSFNAFLPSIESGPWLDLEVSDTGMGMEEQVKERIFDPFFTTKKKGQGTGLGLSVVHGIVKSHGGEIIVESAPGRGTTFHIYLPLVRDEEKYEEQEAQLELPRGTEHILLVDDEPLLVEIMERFLTMLGYKVKGFIDSREALAWFKDNADRVDLVITDMTMPHLTGAELTMEILSKKTEMPIILCTGYSEIMDADRAASMGIRKFLAKPVDNNVLARSVREVLDVVA